MYGALSTAQHPQTWFIPWLCKEGRGKEGGKEGREEQREEGRKGRREEERVRPKMMPQSSHRPLN